MLEKDPKNIYYAWFRGIRFNRNDRLNIKTETKMIDFRTISFIESKTAHACINVLTSTGTFGTLSQLTIGNNPKLFAIDLKNMLIEREQSIENTSVILVGGSDIHPQGIELAHSLQKCLSYNGFKVSDNPKNNDLGGPYSRKCILFPDKVTVFRTPLETSIGQKIENIEINLTFP
jgi:hypothetical protein